MSRVYFLLVVFLCQLSVSAQQSATCKALALQGGGSHGAYQAGALIGLIKSLPLGSTAWDIVTGISAGSLNAGAVSMYATGDEVNLATFLNQTWSSLDGFSSVMRNWIPLGPIQGVLWETALFDSSPLKGTLASKFAGGIKRNITVGATNLQHGTLGLFNESIGDTNMVEACLSSSSIPCIFPMQHFEGEYWVDGGVKMNVNPFDAILRCLDVAAEQDIILDVVYCSAATEDRDAYNYTTVNVIYRMEQIQSYDKSRWMIYEAHMAYPGVTFRYMIQPTVSLKGITSIDFRKEIMMENMEIGYKDGVSAAQNNPAVNPTIEGWRQQLMTVRPFQRTSS